MSGNTLEEEERAKGCSLDSIITHRETRVEMIQCPTWGISCFMDGVIQSCEMDEAMYHISLVHPTMITNPHAERVLIIGGGEGATAREVLKWTSVKQVDMYDWDKDVVQLFQSKYPQWAKGAWENEKLSLHFDNIFDVIMMPPDKPYDVIIIDLFDPEEENVEQWKHLLRYIPRWMTPNTSIVMYAGMVTDEIVQPYQMLKDIIAQSYTDKDVKQYTVPILSFMGDAAFLIVRPSERRDASIFI
jgi:spermidine synthase